jgi:hypothetical protein
LEWGSRGVIIKLITRIEGSDLKGLRYLAYKPGGIYLGLKDVDFRSTAAGAHGRARVVGAWARAGRETLPGKIGKAHTTWRIAIEGLIGCCANIASHVGVRPHS